MNRVLRKEIFTIRVAAEFGSKSRSASKEPQPRDVRGSRHMALAAFRWLYINLLRLLAFIIIGSE